MEAEEIAAVIERLGHLEVSNSGLRLIIPGELPIRLDTPTVRRLVAEAVWRPMPTPVVGHALEMLLEDALDVCDPPPGHVEKH
ncbi:hypothetical protein [Microbacterium maritypicum]